LYSLGGVNFIGGLLAGKHSPNLHVNLA